MKILVTGGAGYIGGTLARLLLSQGHAVTVYDNLCHSRRLAVAANVDFVEGDLADRALLERTLSSRRFDGVMHFAALIEAGESMKHPEVYFRNNTAATLYAAGSDACNRARSARLQFDGRSLRRT